MVMVEVDLGIIIFTILPITQVVMREEVYLGLKRSYTLPFLDKNAFYKCLILVRNSFFSSYHSCFKKNVMVVKMVSIGELSKRTVIKYIQRENNNKTR